MGWSAIFFHLDNLYANLLGVFRTGKYNLNINQIVKRHVNSFIVEYNRAPLVGPT